MLQLIISTHAHALHFFVLVCELEAPKPKNGCKIKTFSWQIDMVVRQVMIFLTVKKI